MILILLALLPATPHAVAADSCPPKGAQAAFMQTEPEEDTQHQIFGEFCGLAHQLFENKSLVSPHLLHSVESTVQRIADPSFKDNWSPKELAKVSRLSASIKKALPSAKADPDSTCKPYLPLAEREPLEAQYRQVSKLEAEVRALFGTRDACLSRILASTGLTAPPECQELLAKSRELRQAREALVRKIFQREGIEKNLDKLAGCKTADGDSKFVVHDLPEVAAINETLQCRRTLTNDGQSSPDYAQALAAYMGSHFPVALQETSYSAYKQLPRDFGKSVSEAVSKWAKGSPGKDLSNWDYGALSRLLEARLAPFVPGDQKARIHSDIHQFMSASGRDHCLIEQFNVHQAPESFLQVKTLSRSSTLGGTTREECFEVYPPAFDFKDPKGFDSLYSEIEHESQHLRQKDFGDPAEELSPEEREAKVALNELEAYFTQLHGKAFGCLTVKDKNDYLCWNCPRFLERIQADLKKLPPDGAARIQAFAAGREQLARFLDAKGGFKLEQACPWWR